MLSIKAEFWHASWKDGRLASRSNQWDEAFEKLTVTRETCFIGTPYRVLCFSDNPILT